MIQFTSAEAMRYRQLMNKSAESLDDSEAAKAPMLFKKWEINQSYTIGERLCYENKMYKVLQDHISQSDWKPDIASSLYSQILIPDPTVIPEWVQPSSTNPYMVGDKVRHNGNIWVSIIDNNVWEPGVYGWELQI